MMMMITMMFVYVEQLNCQRAIDRRSPQNIQSLQMPFDANRFNFTRVKHGEILMELKPNTTQANDVELRTSCDRDNSQANDHLLVSCVLLNFTLFSFSELVNTETDSNLC